MAKLKIGNLCKVKSRYSDSVFLYLPTKISISKNHMIEIPNDSVVMYLGSKHIVSEEDHKLQANSIMFIPKPYFHILYLDKVGYIEVGYIWIDKMES